MTRGELDALPVGLHVLQNKDGSEFTIRVRVGSDETRDVSPRQYSTPSGEGDGGGHPHRHEFARSDDLASLLRILDEVSA